MRTNSSSSSASSGLGSAPRAARPGAAVVEVRVAPGLADRAQRTRSRGRTIEGTFIAGLVCFGLAWLVTGHVPDVTRNDPLLLGAFAACYLVTLVPARRRAPSPGVRYRLDGEGVTCEGPDGVTRDAWTTFTGWRATADAYAVLVGRRSRFVIPRSALAGRPGADAAVAAILASHLPRQ